MNSSELKLELLCRGIRIDKTSDIEKDARPVLRTRGGLGSGLEAMLPGELYINIPIFEAFVKQTPYTLVKENGKYYVYSAGEMMSPIILPTRPEFYDRLTSSGKKMSRIGVMQGTYLGIYPTDVCGFWKTDPPSNCRFCSVGLNLGQTEDIEKSALDVLETAQAAMKEEGITFVHFNAGYLEGTELGILEEYINIIKKRTPLLVGLQAPPSEDRDIYIRLKKAGVDHLSFCIELFDEEKFKEVCPGKSEVIGRERYLDTIKFTSSVYGRGRVSGEIIAGLEPVEKTMEAISCFASMGVVSTVCIFRPCLGTAYEHLPTPEPDKMLPVFRHLYRESILNRIPLGLAPNIKVSIVMLAEEGGGLIDNKEFRLLIGEVRNFLIKRIIRIYFRMSMFFKSFFRR